MLTPDHPGLNRAPQDLRNPGASSQPPPSRSRLPHQDVAISQEVELGPQTALRGSGGMGVPKPAYCPPPLSQALLRSQQDPS